MQLTTSVEDKVQFVEQRAKLNEEIALFMLGNTYYGVASIARLRNMFFILLFDKVEKEKRNKFIDECRNLKIELIEYIRKSQNMKKIKPDGQIEIKFYGELDKYFTDLDNLLIFFYLLKQEARI